MTLLTQTDQSDARQPVAARSLLRRAAPAIAAATAAAAVASGVTAAATSTSAAPAAPAVVGGLPAAAAQSATYTRAVAAAGAADGTKPKVTLIATGGTIAGVAAGRETFGDYAAGSIAAEELIDYLQPELSDVADVEVVQFGNSGSSGYTIEQYHELTLTVERALETSDGVVVTTGTDTQEEFAYWLDLTVQSQEPVVTTGAMRPWRDADGDLVIGADGPANLFNAISLAASQATYCYGTVLMLNDEIHAARDVTKTSTMRMDTFQTREYGALGWIDSKEISLGRATPRVLACDTPAEWYRPFDMAEIAPTDLARTEIVYSYQDAGPEAITAFAEAGVPGIVTAGTGAGGISPDQRAAREAAAAAGTVFVTSSRTGSGTVSGGEGNIIAAGDLLPQKARLLLMLGLTFADGDVEQVRTWFDTIGNPEFSDADVEAAEVEAAVAPA